MPDQGAADDEYWVLTTDEGRALLDEVAAVKAPRPADLMRWRNRADPARVAAAARLADGRRRAASKFQRADRMWFEKTGLEQATAEAVARHKARRFEGQAHVLDLCSGIGGDALALAAKAEVTSVDLDPDMGRRLVWNCGVYDVGERVRTIVGRAEDAEVAGAWVHVDPDRRSKAVARAKRIEGYEPGLEFLKGLAHKAAGGAIKLGPASDFETHFGDERYEVELVSLGGECKEATVWFGGAVSAYRRATRLPEGATWTDCDGPSHAYGPILAVDAYLYDPDPALVRAGLLDGFAEVHGLGRVSGGVDYLTGPALVVSPFLAAFAVLADFPLDLKRLKREVAASGCSVREVKTRGVDMTPEDVRAKLGPSDGPAATLLLAGGLGPSRAILARRVSADQSPGNAGP